MSVVSLFENDERLMTVGMVIAVISRESKPIPAKNAERQEQLCPNKPD